MLVRLTTQKLMDAIPVTFGMLMAHLLDDAEISHYAYTFPQFPLWPGYEEKTFMLPNPARHGMIIAAGPGDVFVNPHLFGTSYNPDWEATNDAGWDIWTWSSGGTISTAYAPRIKVAKCTPSSISLRAVGRNGTYTSAQYFEFTVIAL